MSEIVIVEEHIELTYEMPVNHIIAPPDPQPVPATMAAPVREPDINSDADFPPLALAAPASVEHRPDTIVVEDPPRPVVPEAPPVPFNLLMDLPIIPHDLTGYSSAPSSQDLRDEVDALL